MSNRNLEISLLLLRVSVFLVMAMWTVDKFVNPGHASDVYASFYGLDGLGAWPMWLIGAIELVVLLAFLAGVARTWTYGFVVLAHGVSTLSAFARYMAPFDGPNLLFFAAWPMWAACIALFVLRDRDRLLSLND